MSFEKQMQQKMKSAVEFAKKHHVVIADEPEWTAEAHARYLDQLKRLR
jgi:hypothetical protein